MNAVLLLARLARPFASPLLPSPIRRTIVSTAIPYTSLARPSPFSSTIALAASLASSRRLVFSALVFFSFSSF